MHRRRSLSCLAYSLETDTLSGCDAPPRMMVLSQQPLQRDNQLFSPCSGRPISKARQAYRSGEESTMRQIGVIGRYRYLICAVLGVLLTLDAQAQLFDATAIMDMPQSDGSCLTYKSFE